VNEENKNIYFSNWLLLITLLVILMIIVGGLTRLTDSGLSITKWDLVVGIIPPLSLNDWEKSFDLYKKIPEFKLLNSNMTLDQFKFIYWWEYIHRLLGRVIGLLYIFPLIYFSYKKTVDKKFLFNLYIIFLLIIFQGFIGWYMVKSGLTERTDVSHYRLSLHLTIAFIILILLIWNFLKYNYKKNNGKYKKLSPYLLNIFLIFLIIQISFGAFVSGLDAGKIYQTWPLMGNSFFPDDSKIIDLFSLSALDSPSLVQFLHRSIAYLITLLFLFILFKIFINDDFIYLRKNVLLVLYTLIFQIFLGILTVMSGAHIAIASFHQICSVFLITFTLMLVFKNSKTN